MTPSGRSPKDFFRPLALGAPEPLREIPAGPRASDGYAGEYSYLEARKP